MKKYIGLISLMLISIFMLSACSADNKEKEYPLQKETEHFAIYAQEESSDVIEEVSSTLESQYKSINRNFNIEMSDKINVNIHPKIEGFKRAIGKEVIPDTLASTNYKGNIEMISPKNSEYKGNLQSVLYQARSNVIYIMLGNLNKNINKARYRYLENGITRYEMGISANTSDCVAEALDNDWLPTVEEFRKDKKHTEYTYISYAFVEFIIDEYGYSKLSKFVEDDNIKKSFGISEDEFNRQWKEYAEKAYNSCKLQKETEHFDIYSDGTDMAIVDEVANALESNYDRITNDLRVTIDHKIKMTIHSDIESLQRAFRNMNATNVHMTLWGFANPDGANINIVSPDGAGTYISPEDFLETTVHEFVHAATMNINTNVPSYLNEGIANYETYDDEWVKVVVLERINTNKFPAIQELNQMYAYNDSDAYQLGYAFVRYVVEEYGYDWLVELIKNYDFNAVFGLGEDEFRENWIEYLKKVYA